MSTILRNKRDSRWSLNERRCAHCIYIGFGLQNHIFRPHLLYYICGNIRRTICWTNYTLSASSSPPPHPQPTGRSGPLHSAPKRPSLCPIVVAGRQSRSIYASRQANSMGYEASPKSYVVCKRSAPYYLVRYIDLIDAAPSVFHRRLFTSFSPIDTKSAMMWAHTHIQHICGALVYIWSSLARRHDAIRAIGQDRKSPQQLQNGGFRKEWQYVHVYTRFMFRHAWFADRYVWIRIKWFVSRYLSQDMYEYMRMGDANCKVEWIIIKCVIFFKRYSITHTNNQTQSEKFLYYVKHMYYMVNTARASSNTATFI